MIKKAIEILGECKPYDNLRRGIQFFLSEEYAPPTPTPVTAMSPEPRALRMISEILKSDATLLATYEFNSRMYFGARLADQRGTVFFATTWAGVDAFIKSKKTLRQLLHESTDVWVDSMPELDGPHRMVVAGQIAFPDVFYRDIPSKMRINIL
jgi:hypothetical protein